ncbi:hypothetical protein [Natronomonas sp.]|uniref:hypothetical protein n=1 Tax=Natronomonas sp. TaxID=2184060 RepID=UPI00260ABEF7|nr:hypothetical protein [Natronomonas sp.]
MTVDPIAAAVGGGIAVVLLAGTMIAVSLRHGLVERTLVFPVTMLSTNGLLTLSAVLVGEYTPALPVLLVGTVLIDVGCTVAYCRRLLGHPAGGR